jgi:hypothetical protein
MHTLFRFGTEDFIGEGGIHLLLNEFVAILLYQLRRVFTLVMSVEIRTGVSEYLHLIGPIRWIFTLAQIKCYDEGGY